MNAQLEAKASALMMLRLAAQRWSSALERQLRLLQPGGVLVAPPLPHSPDLLHELLTNISGSLRVVPLLALEGEPGAANPFAGLLPLLPSPREAAGGDAARKIGALFGEALSLLGFHTHFALDLDVVSAGATRGPDSTMAGEAPQYVAKSGAAYLEGLSRHHILGSAGYFPGLGGLTSAPAPVHEFSVSARPMAELWKFDLVPYRQLLDRISLVLMSATAYKAYDYDDPRPAVFSRHVVGGLLRAKLKFGGIVVANQFGLPAVRGVWESGRAAVEALTAGCDLLLVEDVESWQAVQRAIEEALLSGKLTDARFNEALRRVRSAKACRQPSHATFPKSAWERLARQSADFASKVGL